MKNKILKYKNLLKIDNKNLIKRYNEALIKVCGFETKLTEFYIDATGYSPEIAEEMSNREYLNLNRTNRLFILLNLKQSELDFLDLHFTSTEYVFKEFLKDNKKELFTLTSISVVYGEFENNIMSIDKIEDILDCSQIEFHIYTPNNIIEKSKELNEKINKFISNPQITYDCNQDLEEIIELSYKTGDSRVNKFEIQNLSYKTNIFYTSHLGGNYIFVTKNEKTIISETEETHYDSHKKIKFINIDDKKEIYKFLTKSNMVNKVEYEDILEKKDILEEVRKSMAFEELAFMGVLNYDIEYDKYDIKKAIKENLNNLSDDYKSLERLMNSINQNKDIEVLNSIFLPYLFNSKTIIDSVNLTINHLISRLTMYNYDFLFFNNRVLFDKRYKEWSDDKKEFVEKKIIKNMN